MELSLANGDGRTQVSLQVTSMGQDLLVRIFNEGSHIGAVAIGEYDQEHGRSSVSVVTLRGHKDDALAQRAAYILSKHLQKTVCVAAGVHLDRIQPEEIARIKDNTEDLLKSLIEKF